MRALALIDDLWHPGEVPQKGLEGLGNFEWIADGGDWSEERMSSHRLVVLAKANHRSSGDGEAWADEAVGEAFAGHVEHGGGLLVLHSGCARYGAIPAMRWLTGGAFSHHPEPCPVTVEPVAGHPLAAGTEPFTVVDEHYFMEIDDPEPEVFLHTRSEHGLQPAGWRRTVGAGRVCVLTPGHRLEVWLHPGFRRLLSSALSWCSGGNP